MEELQFALQRKTEVAEKSVKEITTRTDGTPMRIHEETKYFETYFDRIDSRIFNGKQKNNVGINKT